MSARVNKIAVPHFPPKTLVLFSAVLLLSGCLERISPFSERTDYRIVFTSEGETALKTYMDEILEDRLEKKIDETDIEEENKRRESYREETIQADLIKALRARGFYEGVVEYKDESEKFTGIYKITPGPQYLISAISVQPENFASHPALKRLQPGSPLDAGAVMISQAELYEDIQKNNCFFSLDINHEAILDQDTKKGFLRFYVKAGPQAKLGEVHFTGQENVENSYLEKLVPWKRGDCFQQKKIEELRTRLLGTGLFSQADSDLPDVPEADGTVPVTIKLKERAPRSVEVGASYYTDEGLGTKLGWEHRNFLGAGEKLETELNISQIRQSISADLTKPFFLRKDQSLSLSSELRLEDTDAYKETALEFAGKINRQINKDISVSLGTGFLLTKIKEEDKTKQFGLLSFPGDIVYDTRDNKLDPHGGWHLTGNATPYFDTFGESSPFLKLQAGARTYFDLGTDRDIVLALRGDTGSIIGADNAVIPASERFYAGGGGSVRGFGYQEVGPRENGDPTGGRSLLTGSAELRFKFTGDFGAVTFIDAGSVSENTFPDFNDMSMGAGAGIRYYTDFGPLRFDVAVPLNNRDNMDRGYQFYVSIGQAF